ncbi:lipoyl synthase [Brachybacterium huguangmaarense]|uniref:Lipoyl synthase n=1 Tax=Brachybacterium huguangmaarense TaxID=1652028 RepID=A0ABY6FZE4_9MICO|nr:lipoyl synthase [Brachybacterium huguangmaarense]UYG16272.1 lipoyl synthase [Brachybacterium huguangmaarense]
MTIAPEGRRLLRVEARNAETPIERKPDWIKTRAVMGPEYTDMKKRVHGQGLHTVCEEAGCPNIFECWEDREASFLIGGDTCTRRCDFCNIATGKPLAVDPMEPFKVARSVKEMGLRYTTITGVARDDLPDGASWLFAETCRQVHAMNPGTGVELLVDDIKGNPAALEAIFDSAPEVFAHNLETVPRIFKQIRPAFRFERSLEVIQAAKDAGLVTKSNLILGMGETDEEIIDTMEQLVESGCDILTITQYLRPSKLHHPIARFLKPEMFLELSEAAEEMGFLAVMAGPMVRSSYRSGRLWSQAMKKLGREIPEDLRHLDSETPAYQEAASVVARRRLPSAS